MSDINWNDGAVCAVAGLQFSAPVNGMHHTICGEWAAFESDFRRPDLKLNEIRTGDYIAAEELDTEQRYNDVVDVFRLFGVTGGYSKRCGEHDSFKEFIELESESRCIIHDIKGKLCFGVIAEEFDVFCKRQLTYDQIMAIGKLKRMMLEREKPAPKAAPDLSADKVTANKYEREITDRQGNSATVDVYDVLKAFNVTCPATQHAVKKLLCTGVRGHKDLETDLIEVKESIARAIELNG